MLIPSFRVTDTVDSTAGFCSSEIIAALAPGLATYIAGSENTFRLIASPLLRPKVLKGERSTTVFPSQIRRGVLLPSVTLSARDTSGSRLNRIGFALPNESSDSRGYRATLRPLRRTVPADLRRSAPSLRSGGRLV